ncbi:MAG: DNA repair protein [Thermodesulfobacteriota bacterium]
MRASESLKTPQKAREELIRLSTLQDEAHKKFARVERDLNQVEAYLNLSEKVSAALDSLSSKLFRELLDVIDAKMTIALQEVLEQPVCLKSDVNWKRNNVSVDFFIDRGGNREDIMKGQGGSVANILSVGLRMFALTTLDEQTHRRFLVLDEQDCWLHPELVPRLVKIVHEAGRELGFQVLMISHHDASLFARYADRVYRLLPATSGVRVEREKKEP